MTTSLSAQLLRLQGSTSKSTQIESHFSQGPFIIDDPDSTLDSAKLELIASEAFARLEQESVLFAQFQPKIFNDQETQGKKRISWSSRIDL